MSYSIFEHTMADMTWPQIEKSIQEGAIILLPTGVIEEHGPHMAAGVDAYLGYLLCRHARDELGIRGINALITPPCYWGINNVTGSFPGSFTISKDTFKALLSDILLSLKRWGVKYVFCINWHDDYHQCSALLEAVNEFRTATGMQVRSVLSDYLAARLGLSGNESFVCVYKTPSNEGHYPKIPDIHAGYFETSIMAKYFPDTVNSTLSRELKPVSLDREEFAIWRQGWENARKMTPCGYLGDPAGFDPEAGKSIMEGLGRIIADLIKGFL